MFTSAFQSFAFQTVSGGSIPPTPTATGGHFLPIYENRKQRKRTLGNISFIYDTARELPKEEVQELLAAVEDYIEPDNENVEQTIIPSFEFINYEALESNKIAYKKFLAAIENIQRNIELADQLNKEDEELLQITLICCTIN